MSLDMELRHILAGVVVMLLAVGMAILLSFGILEFYPQLIGLDKSGNILKREKADTTDVTRDLDVIYEDEIPPVTTVEVTLDKITRYEEDLQNKDRLLSENDSLVQISRNLTDSIAVLFKETRKTLDSINIVHKALAKARKERKLLADSVDKLNSAALTKDDKIERLTKSLEETEKLLSNKMDSVDAEHYKNLAKIYNNSEPEEVARILESVDEKKAAMILRLMRKKNSGQVFDAMNPQAAAAILLLGSTELPPEEKEEGF